MLTYSIVKHIINIVLRMETLVNKVSVAQQDRATAF